MNTDLLVWHLTSDGSYSVKSAYTLLTSALCTLSRSSNFEASKSLWNEIWKLSILNKNQHFLLRACGESLPAKKNLHSRHVIPTKECNLCGDFEKILSMALGNVTALNQGGYRILALDFFRPKISLA